MSPTPAQNSKDIKELRDDYTEFKEENIKTSAQISTQLSTVCDKIDEMHKDQKDMASTLNNLVPIVRSVSEVEIPTIKAEQEKNKSFRWKSTGVASLAIILFVAFVTAGFAWGFRKIDNAPKEDMQEIKALIKKTNGAATADEEKEEKPKKDEKKKTEEECVEVAP